MAFVEIIPLGDCKLGGGTFVGHSGKELAVFRLIDPDRVWVIDNACPHSSGNLVAGDVSGQTVTCPVHAWKFDLKTGLCPDSPKAKVRCYPAQVRDGVVWVDLDAPISPTY